MVSFLFLIENYLECFFQEKKLGLGIVITTVHFCLLFVVMTACKSSNTGHNSQTS